MFFRTGRMFYEIKWEITGHVDTGLKEDVSIAGVTVVATNEGTLALLKVKEDAIERVRELQEMHKLNTLAGKEFSLSATDSLVGATFELPERE